MGKFALVQAIFNIIDQVNIIKCVIQPPQDVPKRILFNFNYSLNYACFMVNEYAFWLLKVWTVCRSVPVPTWIVF